MNLLLDTHVALWAITDDPRLPTKARQLIGNPRATIWVSVASLWEIGLKHALGRGHLPVSSDAALGYFKGAGYRTLAIESEHVIAAEGLPHYHQDPFDRLIVAQALQEPMRLLTHDSMVARYSDTFVLV